MGFWDTFNPFAGMTGEEIYHNFRGNTGDNGAGLYASAFKVQVLVKNYNERTESITALTTSMESAWQGGAGGAARRGAGPLAVEHGLAGDSMKTAETTLGSQFDVFRNAQRTVTEVPPTPDKPSAWSNLTSLGGAERNYENQMGQVNAANDQNVLIMEAYEGESETNASSMPTTYGRITDDYSAVGVERPLPPTPPSYSLPPPNVGSDPGTGGSNNNGTHNLPGSSDSSSNSNNSNNNNTTNPNQNQTTNPSDFRPPSTVDPGRLPPGQNPGQNPNHPGVPGMMPPPSFGPNGGGGGGNNRGFGPGGRGFGPGGSGGMGGPGSSGGPGSGGSGSGARGLGSGFGPGGAAAAEGAAGRGGMGGPGGGGAGGRGMGGGMGGGGRRGEGDDDGEHERPSFLVEPDPHDTFGTDEVTAPPVIGE